MLRLPVFLALLLVLGGACPWPAEADPLDELATEFWAWRVIHQPSSSDDIPRVERPAGWLPDWSPDAMTRRQAALRDFDARWRRMSTTGLSVPRQVDYRLIGSAIARVRWELEKAAAWRRDPAFFIQQSLGPTFDLLLPPGPFDRARSEAIVERLQHAPVVLTHARTHLTDMRRPFARLAIDTLSDIETRLSTMARELAPNLTPEARERLGPAAAAAGRALGEYRDWLTSREPTLRPETAIGRDDYVWFLREVALVPHTPEELLMMGRMEWERAVAFEALEQGRNRGLPPMPIFADQQAQIARSFADEQAIRAFLERERLLTVPSWVKHYRNLPLPAYLAPVAFLGVTDDLTGPSRLTEDGISYIRVPSPTLPYFYLSTARDPRPIIVHEGVPGHYFQLTLSWAHENPIRRRYYDSGVNEGIAFYAEEMMLQAGLWADSARSREIIYNFMRLRALRVEVDVRLATGEFSIQQAADYLAKTVPMDRETALEEAASFATGPGQAITYQIGKVQIVRMLADARRARGDAFSLQAFHDYLWKNGNVPLSLLRWEWLGDDSDLRRLDGLK